MLWVKGDPRPCLPFVLPSSFASDHCSGFSGLGAHHSLGASGTGYARNRSFGPTHLPKGVGVDNSANLWVATRPDLWIHMYIKIYICTQQSRKNPRSLNFLTSVMSSPGNVSTTFLGSLLKSELHPGYWKGGFAQRI